MLRSLSIIILLASGLTTQSQILLELNEALQKALLHNKQVELQLFEEDLAEADLQKLKSAYLPHLQLSYQYVATNDPLHAFGFKLQQANIQSSDFIPDLLNDPDVSYHGQTKISLQQSLFQYDLIALKKSLRARMLATRFQHARTNDKIKLELKNAYTDLQYLYAALETSQNAQNTLKENERVVRNFIQQGLAKNADLLKIQLEISNLEIQINNLQFAIDNLSAYLSFLTGQSLQTKYRPATILIMDSLPEIEMDLSARADIKAMQAAIDARILQRKSTRYGIVPKLNAFGEFNFYDSKGIGFSQNAFLAGIQLQWNIFNGNGRAFDLQKQSIEIQKAKTEMEQMYDQSQLEIMKTRNDLLLAVNDIDLSQKNVLLSEENKRIITDRYIQGLEKTADVLNAELELMQKKLKLMESIAKHNKSIQLLEYLTAPFKN